MSHKQNYPTNTSKNYTNNNVLWKRKENIESNDWRKQSNDTKVINEEKNEENEWITVEDKKNIKKNMYQYNSKKIENTKIIKKTDSRKISEETESNKISEEISSYIKSTNIKIRNWSKLNDSLNNMILKYNYMKKLIESKEYFSKNKQIIIENLAKYRRYDVLEYLRINNNYTKKIYGENNNYNAINSLFWYNTEERAAEINDNIIKDIKLTFNELINYNFTFYSKIEIKKKLINETFLKTLVDPENKMSSEYKDILYDYIMFEYDNEIFWNNLIKNILNKLVSTNFFKQLAYTLMLKFNEFFITELFKQLIDYKVPSKFTEIDKFSVNIYLDIIFSEVPPVYICENNNCELSEFDKFYSRYDLGSYPYKNLNIILKIYNKIIEDKIIKQKNLGNNDIDELVSKMNCMYNYILGYAYQKNIQKDKILEILEKKLNNKPDLEIFGMKGFLFGSKLSFDNMDLSESIFVSNFINRFNNTSNIKPILYYICEYLNQKELSSEFIENLLNPNIIYKRVSSPTSITDIEFFNTIDDSYNELPKINNEFKLPEINNNVRKMISNFIDNNHYKNAYDDLIYSLNNENICNINLSLVIIDVISEKFKEKNINNIKMFINDYDKKLNKIISDLDTIYSGIFDFYIIDCPNFVKIIQQIIS
jgi:hypothetical protein